jgi:DUF1680 family protein
MSRTIARRDFLKTGSLAAGALAYGANITGNTAEPTPQAASPKPTDVRISATSYQPIPDYPIQPKRYSEVTLTDDFWRPKVARNAQVTIPFEVSKFREGPREFGGGVLEAAILSLATHPNPSLQVDVDARVHALSQAESKSNRGFEIAATYYHVTGKRDLVDTAISAADALYTDFKTNNPPFSGGERDAMNCVQLYRVTHDRKHLDLAKHYLDIRGLENSLNRSRHNQSYKPVLEQTEAVGHAVNAVTLMVSMVDVGVLTGLKEYYNAAHRMWTDAVERKMYITGGVGTTGHEGFGEPYSLPNVDAYAETCAVLMFMTLSHRLFMATGDGKYIDVLERGLYNNAIDGVSAAGNRFFYVNRLASAGDGRDLRWERASLECCPPNLVRFFAWMPGYIYAQDPKGAIFVNLYVSSETTFTVGGKKIALSMRSELPWGGRSKLTIASAEGVTAPIRFRIPGWARNQPAPGGLYAYADKLTSTPRVSLNGKPISATADKTGYVTIDRAWNTGDVVELDFPVEVRRVVADRRVRENRGRIAIERGPMVYCAEWPDVDEGKALDVRIDAKIPLTPAVDRNLFGGVTVIKAEARRVSRPSAPAKPVTLIPYFLWANRGAGEMTVWISTEEYAIGDVGPAGGFIFYDNPNHAKDGWRYLEAAPFDQSAGAKWGCFRQLIAGARGTAIGTGKQNTADMLAACAEPVSAAQLCANLSLNGVRGWFLPSRDELTLMYRNLRTTGLVDFRESGAVDNFTYWASSQQTADMSVHVDFADLGRVHGDDKDFPRRVRAIRAF